MKVILASASPRRRELLEQIGWEFEIMVSGTEEKVNSKFPELVVEEISDLKAKDILDKLEDEQEVLVIGADTVVAFQDNILGKPKDSQDAARMIRLLQGKEHKVYTGVTLYYKNRKGEMPNIVKKSFHECAKVQFYPMTESEIEEYSKSEEPLDKAGAYAIQGFCARYIQGIEGEYNTVVGLPVGRLYQEVKSITIQ